MYVGVVLLLAGESIAFGVGVTMPALLILGYNLEISQVILVSVLGGLLGILMMIPLRRALIVQDEGDEPRYGYGVVFPDLPGCTTSGDTVEEAYEHAFEALALHIDGMVEEGASLPAPSPFNAPLPDWLADVPGKIERIILVPVRLPGRAMRISVTMDKGLLARLDAIAAASGETRSGYIARAVRERIEQDRR